jgi:hypothetical protein
MSKEFPDFPAGFRRIRPPASLRLGPGLAGPGKPAGHSSAQSGRTGRDVSVFLMDAGKQALKTLISGLMVRQKSAEKLPEKKFCSFFRKIFFPSLRGLK